MAQQPTRRRFTVDEYYLMGEAGILKEDDRVELVEGQIINMAPKGLRHSQCVAKLTRALVLQLGRNALVWAQNPIRLSNTSEVQPDLALLRNRDYSLDETAPGPADVLLVVEVSDLTLTYDRSAKLPLYARFAIPEYWLVNLKENLIEVCSDPSGDTYQTVEQARPGDALAVPGFSGVTISVLEIL
jgi:Uma2 family endonuclease